MFTVFIAGVFNSFLMWLVILFTYYNGYGYFINRTIPFTQNDIYTAAYLSIAVTAVIIVLFSTKFSDRFFNTFLMNRDLIPRESKKLEIILEEVQEEIKNIYNLPKIDVKLKVKDNKSYNMSAVGVRTIAITRLIYESSSDERLKAVMAHELGHIYNRDSVHMGITFVLIGLGSIMMFINLLIMIIARAASNKLSSGVFVFVGLAFIIIALLAGILFSLFISIFFIFNIFLKYCYRKNELRADKFAFGLGYGNELLEFFENIKDTDYEMKGIKKFLFNTHPKIILRIGNIEKMLESNS